MRQISFLIGLGLTLSTFTKVRLTSEVGIGELLIVLAIILLFFQLIKERKIVINQLKTYLLIIIFIFMLVCTVSNFYNVILGDANIDYARDFIAFMLAATLIVLILLNRNYLTLIDFSANYFYISTSVYVMLLFIYILFIEPFYHIDWFYDSSLTRLTGLSKNPNQLALLLLCIPVLSVNNILKSNRKTLFSILILCASFIIGFKIDSDALILTWFMTIFFVFLYILIKFNMKKIGILSSVFFMSAFVLAVYPYFADLFSFFSNIFNQEENQQASIRYMLWKNGLKAFLHSPLVGNGTFAQSGFNRPFEGVESHNSMIDLLSMVGISGLLLILVLIILISKNNYLNLTVLVFFFQIVIYSNFHNVLRHPLVWFFLLILLVNHKKLILTKLRIPRKRRRVLDHKT